MLWAVPEKWYVPFFETNDGKSPNFPVSRILSNPDAYASELGVCVDGSGYFLARTIHSTTYHVPEFPCSSEAAERLGFVALDHFTNIENLPEIFSDGELVPGVAKRGRRRTGGSSSGNYGSRRVYFEAVHENRSGEQLTYEIEGRRVAHIILDLSPLDRPDGMISAAFWDRGISGIKTGNERSVPQELMRMIYSSQNSVSYPSGVGLNAAWELRCHPDDQPEVQQMLDDGRLVLPTRVHLTTPRVYPSPSAR